MRGDAVASTRTRMCFLSVVRVGVGVCWPCRAVGIYEASAASDASSATGDSEWSTDTDSECESGESDGHDDASVGVPGGSATAALVDGIPPLDVSRAQSLRYELLVLG